MTPTKPLPEGAEMTADGNWTQVLVQPHQKGRPALFLDRDGVVVEEAGYLHKPEDVRLVPGTDRIIALANSRRIPVILITNQSGIGRGYFGWDDFMAVQEKIIAQLAAEDAWIDGVFACPHHAKGKPPYDDPDSPFRKPNPGMLLAAAERMALDLGASWIIGDRAIDLEAGSRAGLPGGLHVLTGHGSEPGERKGAMALAHDGFQVAEADSIAHGGPLIPLFKSRRRRNPFFQ